MFMRISSVIAASMLLAGCGKSNNVSDTLPKGKSDPEKIACATGGAKEFAADCPYEREIGKDGLILTIHHPDGGFRRFLVTKDGRGIVAADGSEAAAVVPLGAHEVEVTVGTDRYRLPATVKGGDAPAQ
jgi:hypothetical protein